MPCATCVALGAEVARFRYIKVATIGDMIFEKLPRSHTAILLVVCIAVLALVGKRIAAAGTARAPAAQAVALDQGGAVKGSASIAPRLVVYVVGAVRHAGLVRV